MLEQLNFLRKNAHTKLLEKLNSIRKNTHTHTKLLERFNFTQKNQVFFYKKFKIYEKKHIARKVRNLSGPFPSPTRSGYFLSRRWRSDVSRITNQPVLNFSLKKGKIEDNLINNNKIVSKRVFAID